MMDMSVLLLLLLVTLCVRIESFCVQPWRCQTQLHNGVAWLPTSKPRTATTSVFLRKDVKNPMALKTIEEYDPTLFSTGSGSCLFSSNIQTANPNYQQQVAISSEDIGEDAAVFNWKDQSSSKWIQFGIAVSFVLGIVNHFWISPTGWKWGDKYKSWLESLAGGNSTFTIVYMLGFFSLCHSGLASLRPFAEKIVGPRVFRYIFAFVSLPLAFSSIVYFINHRNDGQKLWDIKDIPGARISIFLASLVSFLFLYPSSFNLLEIAAVEEPNLHIWTTGIMRITRHPQFIGQVLWCIAHTAYVGTSFMLAASLMLCAHHMFAVWNGDRRLKAKFGKKAKVFIDQTSIIPFAAIISGKQKLPNNYLSEFIRVPYVTIVTAVFGSYFTHKAMIEGSSSLKW